MTVTTLCHVSGSQVVWSSGAQMLTCVLFMSYACHHQHCQCAYLNPQQVWLLLAWQIQLMRDAIGREFSA